MFSFDIEIIMDFFFKYFFSLLYEFYFSIISFEDVYFLFIVVCVYVSFKNFIYSILVIIELECTNFPLFIYTYMTTANNIMFMNISLLYITFPESTQNA